MATTLGLPDAVIGVGADGAPAWPQGIAGSITHTKGYAATLVGQGFHAIGLDAERIGGVTANLFPRLFTERERAALAGLEGAARGLAATLLFSAKESFFKAGLAGPRLVFQAVDIVLADDGFIANGHPGRFAANNDLVVTALALPA